MGALVESLRNLSDGHGHRGQRLVGEESGGAKGNSLKGNEDIGYSIVNRSNPERPLHIPHVCEEASSFWFGCGIQNRDVLLRYDHKT